jgi:hypothetical protein
MTDPQGQAGGDGQPMMSDKEWRDFPLRFKLRVLVDIVIDSEARRVARAAAERRRRNDDTVERFADLLDAMEQYTARQASDRMDVGDLVARLGVRLLPRSSRARYLEEWRGELHDLRAEGALWRHQVAHVARLIAWCAPRTAFVLRRNARRAVD